MLRWGLETLPDLVSPSQHHSEMALKAPLKNLRAPGNTVCKPVVYIMSRSHVHLTLWNSVLKTLQFCNIMSYFYKNNYNSKNNSTYKCIQITTHTNKISHNLQIIYMHYCLQVHFCPRWNVWQGFIFSFHKRRCSIELVLNKKVTILGLDVASDRH